MSLYSNSKTDIEHSATARRADEKAVRDMYEFAPYPDLGADLKDLALYLDPIAGDLARREPVRFLDVGCGTGHVLVGVAKAHPDWLCSGIDLSSASLEIAGALAEKHRAQVGLTRGSYLDPLPYKDKFDVVCAMGTIHHCAEPVAALKNIAGHLKSDGYLLMHLYGLRCDQEKFDIKEALSILEPDLGAYDTRFSHYRALMEHRKGQWLRRFLMTRPIDYLQSFRNAIQNLKRRGQKTSWSPSFREEFDTVSAPWIDHFCHPCERAYEVRDVQALVEAAGLEPVHMLRQSRENIDRIPRQWRARYDALDNWDKWRLSELLSPGAGSFCMILRHGSR